MEPSNAELTLDGNAVGGLLAELFGEDLTGAFGRCPDCGRHAELATLLAFTHAPGVVLRCPVCDGVQVAIAKTPGGYRYEVRVRTDHALRRRTDAP
ncbi:MAG: DUF6510 family protein [Chloroflexota bacterium]|nr:DUF6510 family protein [Chloroflexota bacterium]